MQRQVLDLPRSDSEEDDEADDVLARTLLDQSQDALVTPRDNEHRASTSVLLRHELSVNSDVITRPKPSVDLDLSVMSGVDVPVTSAASAADNRVTSVQSLMATLQTLKTTQRKVAPLSARNHRADTSLSTQQQQVEAHWSGNDVTLQDHDVSADDGEDDVIESDHDKSDDENGNDDCVHALKCMKFFFNVLKNYCWCVSDFDDGESWNDTVTEDDWQKVFLKAKEQENHLKSSAGQFPLSRQKLVHVYLRQILNVCSAFRKIQKVQHGVTATCRCGGITSYVQTCLKTFPQIKTAKTKVDTGSG